ncbi:MAG: hypothetical protein GY749_06285 [Desulfobacteraceae bacterium]|nr:hypothetical protein [Desulfobacteraceae bacterium]
MLLCYLLFVIYRILLAVLPADILLLGGDDLVVYMTAETALPFAIMVAEKFNKKTEQKFDESPMGNFFRKRIENKDGNKGLTISLGIAYGKSHTPFSIMLDQAEQLLKSAKKAGAKDKRTGLYYSPAYIDYHMSTSFNQLGVEDCRINHLELPGRKKIRLFQKPYSLEDAKDILKHARDLKEKEIPGTRLKRFGFAPSLGKVNGTLECLKLYTRLSKGEKRLAVFKALKRFGCMENMPWNETSEQDTTVLVDLIEIADFCEKNTTGQKRTANAPSY